MPTNMESDICEALLSGSIRCGHSKDKGTPYCMYHLCGFGVNCNESVVDAFTPGYNLCEKHKCQMPDCWNEADYNNMCARHLEFFTRDRCEYPFCCEIQDHYTSKYCIYHRCCVTIDNDCTLPRLPGSALCERHKCKLKKCPQRKIVTEDYCGTHRCLLCRNISTSQSLYCIGHRCKRRGCKEYKFCRFHSCVLCGVNNCEHTKDTCTYCRKRVRSGREYCAEHTCKLQGNGSCENGIDCKKYKYFCVNHKCLMCDYTLNCYRHKEKNKMRYADYIIDCLPKDIHSIIISYL
jgi:hypothetical protein